MTNSEHYARLVDVIFGPHTTAFDTNKTHSNRVIGAIANPNNFIEFKANFSARLRRLNRATTVNPVLRRPVINAVNQVAGYSNWDGAFAELAALDYFLSDPATDAINIELDVTVSALDTLASEMGKTNVNYDMRLPSFGVSLDTKVLKDKTGDILDGIFKKVLEKKGLTYLPIIPCYPFDHPYSAFQDKLTALFVELLAAVDTNTRPARFTSKVIPELSYQFAWNKGVYVTAHSHLPTDHALNHQRLLFGYANKFSKVEPSAIVLVHFPWTGEKLYIDSQRMAFFKELGNRFFNAYIGEPDLAQSVIGSFKTSISAEAVTKHLSGVVYLEDMCITESDPDRANVTASYIWNHHALHSLIASSFDSYLKRRDATDLSAIP